MNERLRKRTTWKVAFWLPLELSLRALIAGAMLLFAAGCLETIPKHRYGVRSVEIEGMDDLNADALQACLATQPRDQFSVNFGTTRASECGAPPFDEGPFILRAFAWPWTEWPLYDRAVFERDLARVERWMRARGYYEGRVLASRVDPAEAAESDRFVGEGDDAPCDSASDGDKGCSIDVTIRVREGEPVRVRTLTISGDEALPAEIRQEIREAFPLRVGSTFDEALYDQGKTAILRLLREESYAIATLTGRVELDPEAHSAKVELLLAPGPSCIFGTASVAGEGDLSARTIEGVAAIRTGTRYRESLIEEAQRAVYGIGAFSSVQVEPVVPGEGNVINVIIKVIPGRLSRFGVGIGWQAEMSSNATFTVESAEDIREWDFHALTFYENRNLFGGLRRFRIEERPRLVFPGPFPATTIVDKTTNDVIGAQLGNRISLEFRQPSFIEDRTHLIASTVHDYGPDPLERNFRRHDIDAWIGPQRSFFGDVLFVSLDLHENVQLVDSDLFRLGEDQPADAPEDYHVMFLQQIVRLDFRNDARHPTSGFFASFGLQEAGFVLPSSWNYLRFTPEVRGYFSLPLGIVAATHAAIGVLHVFQSDLRPDDPNDDERYDDSATRLGPDRYRLRGGGPNSNRGFIAGELGDGSSGGTHRWEASLELRIPITVDFGAVTFLDMGDVSREGFRFDCLQTSVGGGLRYQTVVGVARVDLGFRILSAEQIGSKSDEDFMRCHDATSLPSEANLFGLAKWPGAIHLTIGEAF